MASAKVCTLAVTVLALLLFHGVVPAPALDRALTVYGGRMTSDHWFESLPPGVHYVDAAIVVGALSWTLARYGQGGAQLELEAQAGKYFGGQDNMEFNLALAWRWNRFPWDEAVDTSFAFGLGPSLATTKPALEAEINRSTQRFLVYWFGELTLGPPEAVWAVSLRLHHRSKAFGLVAEDGGSNTLAAGLRFRF